MKFKCGDRVELDTNEGKKGLVLEDVKGTIVAIWRAPSEVEYVNVRVDDGRDLLSRPALNWREISTAF